MFLLTQPFWLVLLGMHWKLFDIMYPEMQSVHTVSLVQWVQVIGQGWQSPVPDIAYIEGGQPQVDDDSTVAVVSKLE